MHYRFTQRQPRRNITTHRNLRQSSTKAPEEGTCVKVDSIRRISHNTHVYRLIPNDQKDQFSMPVGSHIVVREGIPRQYTPITDIDETRFIDLMVKIYPHGKLSDYFASLPLDEKLIITGPYVHYTYSDCKDLVMFCGGTGIAPIYQVLLYTLRYHPKTEVTILYANRTSEDILMKDVLDELAVKHDNLKIKYIVGENHTKEEMMVSERITYQMVREEIGHLDPAETNVLVCGPLNMETTIQQFVHVLFKQGTIGMHLFTQSVKEQTVVADDLSFPSEDACCNQSCDNCVWIQYANAFMEQAKKERPDIDTIEEIKANLKAVNMSIEMQAFLTFELNKLEKNVDRK